MSFSICWNDIPEKADSKDYAERCSLVQLEDFCPALQKKEPESYFIEGDNYPALLLLQKKWAYKIDAIYIDPPYNTGKNTFTYKDSKETDEWLSFLKRRLLLARTLLKETGCIFIAIDQSRVHILRLLCDSIFGEENFVTDFMYLHGKGKKDRHSRTMQESNLCYAKNKRLLPPFSDIQKTDWAKTNADGDPRGAWFSGSISFSEERSNSAHPNFYSITSPSGVKWTRQWLISQQEMNELILQNKIFWGTAPEYSNVPRRKIFNGEESEIIPKNILDNHGTTRAAQKALDELLCEPHVFDNPKPVELVQHLIKITRCVKDAVIMDFFAGSGTTFEAVQNLNQTDGGKRTCLLIQSAEQITNKKSRFKTIAELCIERCKRVMQKVDCGTLHIQKLVLP